jgi:hypothetical protein
MTYRFILASAIVVMAALSAHAADPSFSIPGKWETDFGLAELTESGGNVTGSYSFESGKIIGTRSGNRLTGPRASRQGGATTPSMAATSMGEWSSTSRPTNSLANGGIAMPRR